MSEISRKHSNILLHFFTAIRWNSSMRYMQSVIVVPRWNDVEFSEIFKGKTPVSCIRHLPKNVRRRKNLSSKSAYILKHRRFTVMRLMKVHLRRFYVLLSEQYRNCYHRQSTQQQNRPTNQENKQAACILQMDSIIIGTTSSQDA